MVVTDQAPWSPSGGKGHLHGFARFLGEKPARMSLGMFGRSQHARSPYSAKGRDGQRHHAPPGGTARGRGTDHLHGMRHGAMVASTHLACLRRRGHSGLTAGTGVPTCSARGGDGRIQPVRGRPGPPRRLLRRTRAGTGGFRRPSAIGPAGRAHSGLSQFPPCPAPAGANASAEAARDLNVHCLAARRHTIPLNRAPRTA